MTSTRREIEDSDSPNRRNKEDEEEEIDVRRFFARTAASLLDPYPPTTAAVVNDPRAPEFVSFLNLFLNAESRVESLDSRPPSTSPDFSNAYTALLLALVSFGVFHRRFVFVLIAELADG
ncbi:unnamed protein product [Linum tenue]|uniref:Uncharacterized protein n=1 Tax=Linum tenue TaxID=586396 RepID=A0AAV0Q722_9ROSI|nr:unnamed protein product [Linum tenue]